MRRASQKISPRSRVTNTPDRPSSGGVAEAAGSNYETLVAAWYCQCILLGKSMPPLLELPHNVQLTSLQCQSEAPVDDVNARTSD
jgi:hypothetical protein